jgi:hypothetical protein
MNNLMNLSKLNTASIISVCIAIALNSFSALSAEPIPLSSLTETCQVEPTFQGPPPALSILVGPLEATPPPGVTFVTSVQLAIDLGANSSQSERWVIELMPGTYTEQLLIQAPDFPNGLSIRAQESPKGPDASVIDCDQSYTGAPETCIYVLGDLNGMIGESIELGTAYGIEQDQWRGMLIRNGMVTVARPGGGGIRVEDCTMPIVIRGNVIGEEGGENTALMEGGGVWLRRNRSVLMALNEVKFNQIIGPEVGPEAGWPARGAGVFHEWGQLTMMYNKISNNTFNPTNEIYGPKSGGGVYSQISTEESLTVCASEVSFNNAIQGGGIDVNISATSMLPEDMGLEPQVHLEFNEVFENESWIPSYFSPLIVGDFSYHGGGVSIQQQDSYPAGYVTLINNKVHNNRVDVYPLIPPALWEGPSASHPTGVGGGVYLSMVIRSIEDATFGHVTIEGNALYQNDADFRGGGLFYDVTRDSPPTILEEVGHLSANTIVLNSVGQPFSNPNEVDGAGLFLKELASFNGSSNIVFNNVSDLSGDFNWFWESPPDPASDPFTFSQMPNDSRSSLNLFGPQCDDADPMINLSSPPHLLSQSPAIDTGDPNLMLLSSKDIDGDDRIYISGGLIDRGSDEFMPVIFRRGDVNSDSSVNIADAIFLLSRLFSAGEYEVNEDASDINDDGSANIADPIFLLAYLYNGAPPPPEPFLMCGEDPTDDDIPAEESQPLCQ